MGSKTEASASYSIGRLGKPWDAAEMKQWQLRATKDGPKRSYSIDVLKPLELANDSFTVEQYGELKYTIEGIDYIYPLQMAKSKEWDTSKPSALITGGVHGYETSGVKGALLFLETEAHKYVMLLTLPHLMSMGRLLENQLSMALMVSSCLING